MSIVESTNADQTFDVDPKRWSDAKAYRLHIAVIPEEEQDFSAVVLNLPGVGGSGETVEDAIADLEKAFRGTIESYRKSGDEIPWCEEDLEDIPQSAALRWLVVSA